MTGTWRDELPEELKDEPMYKDIPDVPTLAKVARDGRRFVTEVSEKAKKLEEEKARVEAEMQKILGEAKAKEAAAKEADEALRKEWGQAYTEKVAAARAAAKALGTPETHLETMPPLALRAFAEAAARMTGQGNEMGTQGAGSKMTMTKDEARAELERLRDDPKYWDGRHPELHVRAAELTRLAG